MSVLLRYKRTRSAFTTKAGGAPQHDVRFAEVGNSYRLHLSSLLLVGTESLLECKVLATEKSSLGLRAKRRALIEALVVLD